MDKGQKVRLARNLRHNLTDAEERLLTVLRSRQLDGHKFRRQHPIGNYIVDFVCLNAKLIIEIDGGQHNAESNINKDESRRQWLESEGFQLIRFWNNEVLENLEGVVYRILETLSKNGTLI